MLGIRESVGYVYLARLLENETERLGGAAGMGLLAGISQGGAVGMWALFCAGGAVGCLGGFVGGSAWLSFAGNLEGSLDGAYNAKQATL
jgi:lysophospholipase II